MKNRIERKTILSLSFVCLTFFSQLVLCRVKKNNKTKEFFDPNECSKLAGFTSELQDEITSYLPIVSKIAHLVLEGKERGKTYDELALFVDTYPARIAGSDTLNHAINYMLGKFNDSNLDNVHGEKCEIPKWVRGKGWAKITEPVAKDMEMFALGLSVGTDGQPIEGELVQVKSWDELDELGQAGKLQGKIVLYNVKFTTYEVTVQFRSSGADRASHYGAIATLVRSIAPFSIYSPHAGAMTYGKNRKIPAGAIALEDADLIDRWIKRGKTVIVQVYSEAENHPNVPSMNLIADIQGSKKPEEIVVVSGHIDCWDVTQGAVDDGGGMMIAYKALDVLRKLNLRAKRTVKAILWTSEELGLNGAIQYFENRKKDGTLPNFVAFFESDLGTFTPLGLSISQKTLPITRCIVHKVTELFKELQMDKFNLIYEGSDIELFSDIGIPGISLHNANDKYFYYHHTKGDSMSVEDPTDLDKATILWAASSYILADLSISLPKSLEV